MASLLDMWAVWNIRGFMILSLFMQVLLAIVSPLRTKTSNRLVILMIWSTYFLSDWAAMFAFGLITNAGLKKPTSPLQVDQDLLAFWSAFLLIHLGGPDSITAFALEDNALWMRHLVGLVVQILAFLNIFVKTLPDNKLRVPTILMAIAGSLKYGERTRALYLASLEKLKDSMVKSRHLQLKSNIKRQEGTSTSSRFSASNYNPRGKEIEMAFQYFQIFKGLVVEMMPDHSQRQESRVCFLNKGARETFDILKMELEFFYEMFYTKVLAANSAFGVLIRSLAFYNILVALIMFCLIEKAGMHGVDVRITYTLLAGLIAVDSASEILLVGSNFSKVNISYAVCQMLGHGVVLFCIVGVASMCTLACFSSLCCKFAFRQWSESTGGVSILVRAFEESRPRKGWSKLSYYWRYINGKINDKMGVVILTKLPYQRKNKFRMELWDFVFYHLKVKASPAIDADRVSAVYEARGEGPLSIENLGELRRFIDEYEFEHSILIWHCATEICYQDDNLADLKSIVEFTFGKILSDYMLYLLIKQPKLMSPMAGIEEIRYRETIAEAKGIFKRHPVETMEDFCKKILDEYKPTAESNDRRLQGKSVLPEACVLANILKQKGMMKWDVISKVWVEMLLYAAGHSRADSHVRLLTEGGEFITFVWQLMAHMGIIARFPNDEEKLRQSLCQPLIGESV